MSRSLREELEGVFRGVRVEDEPGRLTITVEPAQVIPVLRMVKDRGFDHFTLLAPVDRIADGVIELVYVLAGYSEEAARGDPENALLMVKTPVSREEPHVESAIEVFPNLEPYEREAHELFGVFFEGHPRLTPLFLEREYPVPPFRKDFDTRKYVENVFDSIPPVEEGGGE
jgi:NADH-quinone oxidoreductase subunit C